MSMPETTLPVGVPQTGRQGATFGAGAGVGEASASAPNGPILVVIAYGDPAPQGSKKVARRGSDARKAVLVESSKRVKPWRQAVSSAASDALDELCGPIEWRPLDGPLEASMTFTLPKPASAPKRRRSWPCRYPDVSKLLRATEDALTDAGVWRDDARVVRYRDLAKVYSGEDPDALRSPGVLIRIWPVTP